MPLEVKICGLSSLATLDAALDAGADYVGLVFHGPSPRNVSLERAAALAARARGRARVVALVVDAADETLADIVSAVEPDMIQAHGGESPARVKTIAARTRRPVIKAIRVSEAADVARAAAYAGAASLVLFDAKAPETLAASLPGGNGLAFDWHLLEGGKPPAFMLAGGLTPENVAQAVRITGAPIVDVSSGVESAPGVKDADLIRKFIEAAKAAR